MSKPVNKIEFWKQRIDTAVKEHYMVYVTSEGDWKRINQAHREILGFYIKPTDKVLDAGCAHARMAELFSDENYTGVDFSPDFIKLAKEKYSKKNFLVADLKSLPFQEDKFDWAFCISIKKMIIDNLGENEWSDMEKELTRVAKKVLILEYESPKPHEVIQKDKRTFYENC